MKYGDEKSQKMPQIPKFSNFEEERLHIKQRLAAGFRLFSKFGYEEGVAGHITARDPEFKNTFWVNPFGVSFSEIKVSNLLRADHEGNVIEGNLPLNAAAFAIHSRIHSVRKDVSAAAHSHSKFGRAWSTLGRKLDYITLDSCAFFNDHSLFNDFGGVVIDLDEGNRVVNALGNNKAVILQNHGLLTVGETVDSAVWWYITMEKSCEVQLIAESVKGDNFLKVIGEKSAKQAHSIVGSAYAGWFQFQPLFSKILKEQPDLLD
tara:strand:- start:365 stop:1150 length:786 start_codon:yes stop_codon:yes gene_type:complete